MIKASFTINFDSEEDARVITKSIEPEILKKIPKTKVNVKSDKNIYKIIIEAQDISSLRAACNSYLRWINTALNVKKTI